VLSIENLNIGYDDSIIVEDLSLVIEKGEIVTIIGPNGSGKSTCLNCLTRYIKPISGHVMLDDENIYLKHIKDFSKRVAILSQHNNLNGNITVEQLVSYGRSPHKRWYERRSPEDHEIVEQAMRYTDIFKYKDNSINSLSGGERQRVWISMALAQTPDLLLLDEPTTYLDISHQLELMEMIKSINRDKGITVIMVLHDLNQASHYSDKIVLMKSGRVFAHGTPKEVINCKNLREVYDIDCHICEYQDKSIVIPLSNCTKF